jgi:hypothetical protein
VKTHHQVTKTKGAVADSGTSFAQRWSNVKREAMDIGTAIKEEVTKDITPKK